MPGNLKKALIIFARKPAPGRVKTRLTPLLTEESAAELYRCMLLDTLAKVGELAAVDKLLFYEDEDGAALYFREIAGGLRIFPQEGAGLGERMEGSFRKAFALGYGTAAIIGTDSPDLPPAFVEEAFHRLDTHAAEAVLGPTDDGGYYLLAMNRLHGALFRDIPWSSGEVLRESLERAAEAGISVALLPRWYDVDTVDDLKREELLNEGSGAPLTREFIKSRLKAEG